MTGSITIPPAKDIFSKKNKKKQKRAANLLLVGAN
jgi:hypothetical protein